jgi:Predicted transcriptional regulator
MSSMQLRPKESDDVRTDRRAEMARALARGGMEGVHVLSLETAQTILTPERYRIIELLSREELPSVRELARRLNRDKGQVSRDLGILAEHGVIAYDTDGRSKSPRLTQQRLVIEPLV